jgi:NADPH:quinone reductase-like Zn-dependent oxidoreductase
MSWVRKGLLGIAGTVAVAAIALGVALSYEAPCPASGSGQGGADRMRAAVHHCYGSAEVLNVEIIDRPTVAEDHVLIQVVASSVNPADWHQMTGKPYVMRLSEGFGSPKYPRRGVDFAGRVVAVGAAVTKYKVGDEVFGAQGGAFAEYLSVTEDGAIAIKPDTLSFEQAAAMPVAAVTALQGLREQGGIKAGDKVLINGASGGVGTFAVQIAKSMGAEVTGVCSTRNVELVRSLGADHVIDYTQTDFTQGTERFDVILDLVGNHALLDVRRALKPGAKLVIIGGPKRDPWLGPAISPIKAIVLSPFIDEKMEMFIAQVTEERLRTLAELASTGAIKSVIDRRYALSEISEAMQYLGTQRARGKVIIDIDAVLTAHDLNGA